MRRTCVCSSVLALAALAATSVLGLGSGGILNFVPQAEVWLYDGDHQFLDNSANVYVHPMEGSLLVVWEGDEKCIALDKNRRHAVEVSIHDLAFSDDRLTVDAPEDTPYRVLRNNPHFNRLRAELALEDGRVMVIKVPR